MLNTYINRDIVEGPWGGGNQFVKAFYQYAKQNNFNVVNFNTSRGLFDKNPDIVFLMSPDGDKNNLSLAQLKDYFRHRVNKPKYVLRVNDCDARKNTTNVDTRWCDASQYVDTTLWVSEWLHQYFVKSIGWNCRDSKVLINGVDKSVFKPRDNKINNSKVNIVTAHWSDNFMKGEDYVKFIDEFVKTHSDRFTYTFIGRTKANLKHSRHIAPIFGEALGTELSKYDICVNASRFDPGPNSVIESMSSGVETWVHRDGGGAVEFAGKSFSFSRFDDVESLLLTFSKNNVYKQRAFEPWQLVMKKLFSILEENYYVTKQ